MRCGDTGPRGALRTAPQQLVPPTVTVGLGCQAAAKPPIPGPCCPLMPAPQRWQGPHLFDASVFCLHLLPAAHNRLKEEGGRLPLVLLTQANKCFQHGFANPEFIHFACHLLRAGHSWLKEEGGRLAIMLLGQAANFTLVARTVCLPVSVCPPAASRSPPTRRGGRPLGTSLTTQPHIQQFKCVSAN